MAELFPGNYVHPDYATPEQLAQQRAYAAELLKRSGENVNRPTGAIGNMISALTAGLERNRANEIQSQAASQNARDQAELISQLQSGRQADPRTLGTISANPLISPETRALVNHLLTMKPTEDVAGRPATQSPAGGVVAAPIVGGFQPGFRAPESAGSVSTVSPVPAPPFPGQTPAQPAVAPSPKWWGNDEAIKAGLYPPSTPQAGGRGGPPVPVASPPAATVAPAAPGSRLDALAETDRRLSAAKTFTQGGAESVTGTVREDISAAMNAPTIKRVAGVMLDDLRTHGDKMTFGPTAEWSNTIKRAAANYAPGLMKDQLESLASADSFDKMSAQLTSMLAKGGGTDAQLFNNMKSVPGAHNSKEGAEALLKMVNQVADQQASLRNYVGRAQNIQEYEALRSRFFQENPVINPITGNPIAQDIQNQRAAGGGTGRARIISVEPAR